jgi:hypothetical protein
LCGGLGAKRTERNAAAPPRPPAPIYNRRRGRAEQEQGRQQAASWREGGRERGREGERSLLTSPLGFDLRSVVVVDWRARNRLRSAAGKEGRTRQAGMMDG